MGHEHASHDTRITRSSSVKDEPGLPIDGLTYDIQLSCVRGSLRDDVQNDLVRRLTWPQEVRPPRRGVGRGAASDDLVGPLALGVVEGNDVRAGRHIPCTARVVLEVFPGAVVAGE